MKLPGASRGFSLIEILVAFVILSLTLGVIMQIFSGGLRNVRRSDDYSRALFLAESRLAALGVEQPLHEGGMSGELDRRYHWQILVQPYREAVTTDETQLKVGLYRVMVVVNWDDGRQARHLELTSLRLVPRP
ncbi:MAG: prepilin-type N-terminal cleavage/methylation domain-containing protein [Sulfuricella denitrificans]|nr:prepilin-type N-terminal cleavage/methylation domain-containing protein [Sulfuricella denitrificans]